jgi:hypothetical protein
MIIEQFRSKESHNAEAGDINSGRERRSELSSYIQYYNAILWIRSTGPETDCIV